MRFLLEETGLTLTHAYTHMLLVLVIMSNDRQQLATIIVIIL